MSNLCYDVESDLACIADFPSTGACTTVFVSNKFGVDTDGNTAVSTIYHDKDGNVVDVTGLNVFLGSCPIGDNEYLQKCELLADGTEVLFTRCVNTKTLPDGTSLDPTVTDYTPDFSAKYTVVDEANVFVPAPKCSPLTSSGVVTDWKSF